MQVSIRASGIESGQYPVAFVSTGIRGVIDEFYIRPRCNSFGRTSDVGVIVSARLIIAGVIRRGIAVCGRISAALHWV